MANSSYFRFHGFDTSGDLVIKPPSAWGAFIISFICFVFHFRNIFVFCFILKAYKIILNRIVMPYEYHHWFKHTDTVKPLYNDHLMGYFSAFWGSSRWPRATYMSSRRQKLLTRINCYIQSSLKHITELITGVKSYYRGGRFRQVSLYMLCVCDI